jgi:hypothetical protein
VAMWASRQRLEKTIKVEGLWCLESRWALEDVVNENIILCANCFALVCVY